MIILYKVCHVRGYDLRNKPFHFWQEIWIQVLVILLKLYVLCATSKLLRIVRNKLMDFFFIILISSKMSILIGNYLLVSSLWTFQTCNKDGWKWMLTWLVFWALIFIFSYFFSSIYKITNWLQIVVALVIHTKLLCKITTRPIFCCYVIHK